MLLNSCFIFPAGIFNWMSLPFDQVFQILFLPSLLANSLVEYVLHLWLFSYRNLFCPLDLFLFNFCSCFFNFLRIQIAILNIGEILIPSGSSISYVFAQNFFMTLHGPIFFIFNLLYVSLGNLSFLRCERTR
jgi:hypothetical protein